MKTLILEARAEEKFLISEKIIAELPKQLVLACTIQYYDSLAGIKEQLENSGIQVELFGGIHSILPGQILGCDLVKVEKPFLYVGDGDFHPKAVAYASNIEVLCYEPVAKKLTIITKEEVEKVKKRRKGALLKFHEAKNIGVIVSIKPGQNWYKDALKLEEKYSDKRFSYFLCDIVDFNCLEDYSFIDVWVNTACSRIGWEDLDKVEKPMVNLQDV